MMMRIVMRNKKKIVWGNEQEATLVKWILVLVSWSYQRQKGREQVRQIWDLWSKGIIEMLVGWWYDDHDHDVGWWGFSVLLLVVVVGVRCFLSLSFCLVFYWRQRPPSCHIRWHCTEAKSTSVGCVWESEWSAIYYYDSLLRKRNQPAFHIIREKNKDTDFSFTYLTIPILSILSFFSQENEWRGRVRSKEKESMKLEKMTREFPNSFYTHINM